MGPLFETGPHQNIDRELRHLLFFSEIYELTHFVVSQWFYLVPFIKRISQATIHGSRKHIFNAGQISLLRYPWSDDNDT